MTETEKKARIEELRTESYAAMVRCYTAEAEIDRLQGEPLSEEFHLAMAECYRTRGASPEAQAAANERKDRAYVRVQAARCIDGDLTAIDPKDRPAILAEIERLRSECKHEDDGGPFFAKCGKCGETLDHGGDS